MQLRLKLAVLVQVSILVSILILVGVGALLMPLATSLALAAPNLVIEATGDGPDLSDVPAQPYRYFGHALEPLAGEASPTEQILRTLTSPRALLGLPDASFDIEAGGAFPYVGDPGAADDGAWE